MNTGASTHSGAETHLGAETHSGAETHTGAETFTDLSVTASDARTTTVDVPFVVQSVTSGVPAAGIGTGILVRAESADENPSDFGQWEFAATDVGTGTEDTYFQVLLRVAGAALTSCYRFVATGAFNAIFTHANTAARTYTLPNRDVTVGITLGTETATTSGTSIDFTGIPSGVRRIEVCLSGVSAGASGMLIQIGDSGGIEATGYIGAVMLGASADATETIGFQITAAAITATGERYGIITLVLADEATFRWVQAGVLGSITADAGVFVSGGRKLLSAELDRVRLTTVGGVNTFDNGVINISYAW